MCRITSTEKSKQSFVIPVRVNFTGSLQNGNKGMMPEANTTTYVNSTRKQVMKIIFTFKKPSD